MAKGQLKIDEMYAFIALDPADNTEGIISFNTGDGPIPMVGADMAMVELLRPFAQAAAEAAKATVTLVRFSQRTNEEIIEP